MPRRAFRAGARETRVVPRAARDRADGEASSRASAKTSDEPSSTEIPVSFSGDEDEASAGEGSAGHDVVRDAQQDSSHSKEAVEEHASIPTGWDTKPKSIMPSAYFQGEVGYSKFYPPEARDYEYKRKLMVAVDGTAESERAVEWAIKNLCRSGDLLQIVHCCLAGALDPRLAAYYDGPSIMSGDQIRAHSRLSRSLGNAQKPEYPERFPKRPMYDDSWAPTRLKDVRVRRARRARPKPREAIYRVTPERTSSDAISNVPSRLGSRRALRLASPETTRSRRPLRRPESAGRLLLRRRPAHRGDAGRRLRETQS